MVGGKKTKGGTLIACSSVLNAVNASQPSGKKTNKAVDQAAIVRIMSNDFSFMFLIEILADHADQKKGGDIGQHYGE
jgi:hypothetical protein